LLYVEEGRVAASKWALLGALAGWVYGFLADDWVAATLGAALALMLILNAIVTKKLIWTGRFGESTTDAEELLCFLYVSRNRGEPPPGTRPFPTDAEIEDVIREVSGKPTTQPIG
jgi:hypothetical protein